MGWDADGWTQEGWSQPGWDPVAAITELAFVGPNIGTINLVVDVAMMSRNFAGRFASPNAITYTLDGTPPDGVTLDSSGVLSGTPTETGDFTGLKILADDGVGNAESNEFTIRVIASGIAPGVGDGSVGDGFVSDGNVGDGYVGY